MAAICVANFLRNCSTNLLKILLECLSGLGTRKVSVVSVDLTNDPGYLHGSPEGARNKIVF